MLSKNKRVETLLNHIYQAAQSEHSIQSNQSAHSNQSNQSSKTLQPNQSRHYSRCSFPYASINLQSFGQQPINQQSIHEPVANQPSDVEDNNQMWLESFEFAQQFNRNDESRIDSVQYDTSYESIQLGSFSAPVATSSPIPSPFGPHFNQLPNNNETLNSLVYPFISPMADGDEDNQQLDQFDSF